MKNSQKKKEKLIIRLSVLGLFLSGFIAYQASPETAVNDIGAVLYSIADDGDWEHSMQECLDRDGFYWDQETDKCYQYKQKCTDPDGGKDRGVQAHTFGFRYEQNCSGDKDCRIRTGGKDACIGDTLREHYCADDYHISTYEVRCGYGCADGRCLENSTGGGEAAAIKKIWITQEPYCQSYGYINSEPDNIICQRDFRLWIDIRKPDGSAMTSYDNVEVTIREWEDAYAGYREQRRLATYFYGDDRSKQYFGTQFGYPDDMLPANVQYKVEVEYNGQNSVKEYSTTFNANVPMIDGSSIPDEPDDAGGDYGDHPEQEIQCPEYDTPELPSDCFYEWIKDSNGCKRPRERCQAPTASEVPKCPEYYPPKPPEGCWHNWTRDDNGCPKAKIVCEDEAGPACPAYHAKPAPGCWINWVRDDDGCPKPEFKCKDSDSSNCPSYHDNPKPDRGCWYEWKRDDKGCKVPYQECKEEEIDEEDWEDHDAPPAGYEDEVYTSEGDGISLIPKRNWFTDVHNDNDVGKAANVLADRGIIGGFPDGSFRSGSPVNRAEAAKFLLLAMHDEVPEYTNEGRFWDVKEGEWYVKYVIKAAKLEIIAGYPDGSFKPGNTVNTVEFLKMATKAFGLSTSKAHSFYDVQDDAWFAPYVGIAAKYDLFSERGNKLEPDRQLTRGEVAVAIARLLANK